MRFSFLFLLLNELLAPFPSNVRVPFGVTRTWSRWREFFESNCTTAPFRRSSFWKRWSWIYLLSKLILILLEHCVHLLLHHSIYSLQKQLYLVQQHFQVDSLQLIRLFQEKSEQMKRNIFKSRSNFFPLKPVCFVGDFVLPMLDRHLFERNLLLNLLYVNKDLLVTK